MNFCMAKVKYNIKDDVISISEQLHNQSKVVHVSQSFENGHKGAEKRTRSTKYCASSQNFWQNTRNNAGVTLIINMELNTIFPIFPSLCYDDFIKAILIGGVIILLLIIQTIEIQKISRIEFSDGPRRLKLSVQNSVTQDSGG